MQLMLREKGVEGDLSRVPPNQISELPLPFNLLTRGRGASMKQVCSPETHTKTPTIELESGAVISVLKPN